MFYTQKLKLHLTIWCCFHKN